MRQPDWDRYEIALLIEACQKVNKGLQAKKQVVKSLSNILRSRAVRKGVSIGSTFRNENGIALQMAKMNYLLTDARNGLSGASRSYMEMALLFQKETKEFEGILNQAHREIEFEEDSKNAMSSLKDSFILWLNEKSKLKYPPRNIVAVIDEGSEYAVRHGISKRSFWSITEVKDYNDICRKLLSMRLFRVTHRKAALIMDKAYVYFSEFLSYLPNMPTVQSSELISNTTVATNGEESASIDFSSWLRNVEKMAEATVRSYVSSLNSAEAFAVNKGIEGICLTGDCATALASIEKLLANKDFVQFNRDQHNRFSASFRKLRDYIAEVQRHEMIDSSDKKLEIEYPDIYHKIYAISKVYDDPQGIDTNRIMSLLENMLTMEDLIYFLDRVSWARKISTGVYSFARTTAINKPTTYDDKGNDTAPSDFNKDEFISVLMQRYQNGLQFDSIDLDNFRETYNSTFDKPLSFTDEGLIARLKYCGILYQDRIFPAEGVIDNVTKDKLFDYIERQFASGKKVLYYKSIFTDLADAFAYCFSLTDETMLRSFIEYSADEGKYYFNSNYMSMDRNVKIDTVKEIADFMLAAGKPLSYDDIYAGLSHISHDVIYREIQTNSCFLRNEKEHYFHIDIFEFSASDSERISVFLNKEIEENGYAIWSRVFAEIQEQMPVFLENNLYLSSLGIRNALSRLMSNQYAFESEVISTHGNQLSMADVYSLYGKHHAPFSDDDIYAFSKEIGTVIYFDSLSNETVRVSRKLFISKNNIDFDIEAVDNALGTYLSSGYIFIKDVDSFLVFPNVGYEWNEFLLESYLQNYSKKFSLINNGSSLNNVAGAMVKKDGEYTQFIDICAHALAESGVELKKESALNYLADVNLITRRSYRELENALTKARQIRNRKG